MRSPARRAAQAAVIVLFLALLVVPLTAYASDSGEPLAVQAAAPAVEDVASTEVSSSIDATEPAEADVSDEASDAPAPVESAETSAAAAPESDEASPGAVVLGGQFSSQATADTRRAIEALLKARKRQFDAVANELQRTIDQLAAIVRKLDAAGVNVSAARARLTEARVALYRARALERVAVARYRGVLSADDQRDAYARARAAARSSSAQLERARIKVITATKTLRAIVKNVTVQNVGASTDST